MGFGKDHSILSHRNTTAEANPSTTTTTTTTTTATTTTNTTATTGTLDTAVTPDPPMLSSSPDELTLFLISHQGRSSIFTSTGNTPIEKFVSPQITPNFNHNAYLDNISNDNSAPNPSSIERKTTKKSFARRNSTREMVSKTKSVFKRNRQKKNSSRLEDNNTIQENADDSITCDDIYDTYFELFGSYRDEARSSDYIRESEPEIESERGNEKDEDKLLEKDNLNIQENDKKFTFGKNKENNVEKGQGGLFEKENIDDNVYRGRYDNAGESVTGSENKSQSIDNSGFRSTDEPLLYLDTNNIGAPKSIYYNFSRPESGATFKSKYFTEFSSKLKFRGFLKTRSSTISSQPSAPLKHSRSIRGLSHFSTATLHRPHPHSHKSSARPHSVIDTENVSPFAKSHRDTPKDSVKDSMRDSVRAWLSVMRNGTVRKTEIGDKSSMGANEDTLEASTELGVNNFGQRIAAGEIKSRGFRSVSTPVEQRIGRSRSQSEILYSPPIDGRS